MKTILGRRTRILAATTATAGLLLVAGCSSDDGGSGSKTAAGGVELVKAGQLTTCTHLPYPPFQSEIDGKVQGFDVSLIDLVAKNLGVKQEILDTPFENFKTGAFLNSGECDVAAAGMTITEERKKNVDFSDPYFDATQALLVDKDSGITSSPTPRPRRSSSAPRPRPPARTTPRARASTRSPSSPPTPSSTVCAPARSRPSSSTTRWSRAG